MIGNLHYKCIVYLLLFISFCCGCVNAKNTKFLDVDMVDEINIDHSKIFSEDTSGKALLEKTTYVLVDDIKLPADWPEAVYVPRRMMLLEGRIMEMGEGKYRNCEVIALTNLRTEHIAKELEQSLSTLDPDTYSITIMDDLEDRRGAIITIETDSIKGQVLVQWYDPLVVDVFKGYAHVMYDIYPQWK